MIKTKRKGSAPVELTMVMTLMLLIGVTIFTVIQLGSENQRAITEDKDIQVDARIAAAYINVRIRQNDEDGRLFIKTVAATGKDAVVFRERSYETSYDTWIFYADGKLYECITDADEQPELRLSTAIAEIDDYTVTYDANLRTITNHITFMSDGAPMALIAEVAVRSSGIIQSAG